LETQVLLESYPEIDGPVIVKDRRMKQTGEPVDSTSVGLTGYKKLGVSTQGRSKVKE
jgi:hypothetical protein